VEEEEKRKKKEKKTISGQGLVFNMKLQKAKRIVLANPPPCTQNTTTIIIKNLTFRPHCGRITGNQPDNRSELHVYRVKVTPEQATRAQTGSRGIALLFL